MQPDDPNSGGNHRKSMLRTVEGSLQRLNTDYIDLLYLHAWDFTTSVEEIMRAMDDLVRAGKVLYVAVSTFPPGRRRECKCWRPAWLVAADRSANRVQSAGAHRRTRADADGARIGDGRDPGRRWPAAY